MRIHTYKHHGYFQAHEAEYLIEVVSQPGRHPLRTENTFIFTKAFYKTILNVRNSIG